jgi:hypothetical protein
MKLPQALSLLLPKGFHDARARQRLHQKHVRLERYWADLPQHTIAAAVDNATNMIQGLTDEQMRDCAYLEHQLIPRLGLNNENLHEQPPQLSPYFGSGLHVWQYPNQLAPFLVWLATRGESVRRYMEIGVRWGGTFIVISEFLRRVSGRFEKCIAVDPMPPSRLLRRYLELGKVEYVQCFSTDETFRKYVAEEAPDFVFIDGDHTLRVALHDYDVCSEVARYIGFHDIASDGCAETTQLWKFLKRHCQGYEFAEFVDQYPSVDGNFMGIGLMSKNPHENK